MMFGMGFIVGCISVGLLWYANSKQPNKAVLSFQELCGRLEFEWASRKLFDMANAAARIRQLITEDTTRTVGPNQTFAVLAKVKLAMSASK